MARDPAKAKERKRRYIERKKIQKYGAAAAGQDMRGRHGRHRRGEAHRFWGGGRIRTSQGYIAVSVPDDHHLRMATGYAYEHQLIAEQILGRRLAPGEVVHHRNGRRDDNRPENLDVLLRGEHSREHASCASARDSKGRFVSGQRVPEDCRVRELPEGC